MGDIVSFYSFKGGTGRSTSLSNVAFELAQRGYRVGCMDFDLSAPGLHMIFDIGANKRSQTRTIHDYLDPEKSTARELDDYVLDLSKSYWKTNFDGELLLMPGDINADVAAEMAKSPRENYLEIQGLISDFEAQYDLDYVFLDSRSGISNQAMPIFRSANVLLTFTRWTYQHKLGTYELLDWILETVQGQDDYFDDIVGVVSNVPGTVTREEIGEWVEHELPYAIERHEVIYESELLKEQERIIMHEYPDSELAKQFGNLADLIGEL